MEVSITLPKNKFYSDYRPLIPSPWLVDVEPLADGRRVNVVLKVSAWARPVASVWRGPRSLSFSRRDWDGFFSFLIPDQWVQSCTFGPRSVDVELLVKDGSALPLAAGNPSLLIQ